MQPPVVLLEVPRCACRSALTVIVYVRVRNSLGRGISGSLRLYYMPLLQYAAGWKLIYINIKSINELAIMPTSLQGEYSPSSAQPGRSISARFLQQRPAVRGQGSVNVARGRCEVFESLCERAVRRNAPQLIGGERAQRSH